MFLKMSIEKIVVKGKGRLILASLWLQQSMFGNIKETFLYIFGWHERYIILESLPKM